ncbi:MAG: hypothetical protein E7047_06765 [Lentisphaerae bacterium]|nr:hypothetical protein [Lentisphaerota bacterium]
MRTDKNIQKTQDNEQYNQYGGGVQAFMKAGHWVFLALVGLIFAMLVYFFTLGGYFSVSPQEAVIVLRFGKYENTYTSDWHWFLPDPVTSKVVIPTNPQTLQVSFNSGITAEQLPPPGPNGELPGLQPGRDSYLLTADECIIHASWSARIAVSDPTRFYEEVLLANNPAGPDDIIKENGEELGRRGARTLLSQTLKSAVIMTTASFTIDDILYKNQEKYRAAVEDCYRKMIENMNIGVTVEEVRLNGKVMPPMVTQGHFDALTAITAQQETMRKKAEENKARLIAEAETQAAQIRGAAENYRKRVVAEVEADKVYFETFLEEYKKHPKTALSGRYQEVLSEVLSKIDQKFVLGAGKGGKLWLKLSPELPKPKSSTGAGAQNNAGGK